MISTSTSAPESESPAEPESESATEPESESAAEPESESTTEPESESTTEPESESATEPESESTTEPESESPSEPESESAAEPESESPSEPESEPTTEPESESATEPESESATEPESESATEPESESATEPESESATEPESESATEPESESPSEPESESTPEVYAEQRPSDFQILAPPVMLMLVICIALYILSLCNQKTTCCKNKEAEVINCNQVSPIETVHSEQYHVNSKSFLRENVDCGAGKMKAHSITVQTEETSQTHGVLSHFDLEVIESLQTFYNGPSELLRIALPALISLALCPITLYLYPPLVRIFWPPSKFPQVPNINDAIGCFLAPAGLVYATSFGFAFQSALSKQHEIYTRITSELSLIDQIVTLTTKLAVPSKEVGLDILKAVKAEAIFMVLQITDNEPENFKHKPEEDVKVKIWSVIDNLKKLKPNKDNFDEVVNRILVEEIIGHIMELNSICSDRMGAWHTRIPPLKWMFLETLGFFSFFGVLLLTTKSYILELVMCVITVFSISLLCYVVSDFDSPFSGFFRVDLTVLDDVITRIDEMYKLKSRDDETIWYYPAKKKTKNFFKKYLFE
ncbi:uncharacterized protein LOC141906358 [Tubulanus polymorphus]|uniref:uncharacterized protein LOC141906358 n=1 Tax=Tubulanus polymorphus TaxID=672921 RepID=UPI003DA3D362